MSVVFYNLNQCVINAVIFRESPQTKAIQWVLLYKCFAGDMCPKSVQSGPCDNKALCSRGSVQFWLGNYSAQLQEYFFIAQLEEYLPKPDAHKTVM